MSKNLRSILWLSVLLAFVACNPNEKKGDDHQKTRPNIIFIMSDDHACRAISCYGNSINETPNIDRLSREGVRFTRAFCTNAICAPSRAVMLTGKYSHINGLINNNNSFDGDQMTFPKLLQQNGYQTALIGKWHLKSEPTGFDYWNILPGQGSYYNPGFIENGENKKRQGYVTELISSFTIDWLENRDTTKPFCVLMHHKAPHRTWMPDQSHLNSYDSIDIPVPPNFFDYYENRSAAAREQKMSIARDMLLGYDLKLTKDQNSNEIIEDSRNHEFDRMTPEQRRVWDSAYKTRNDEFYMNPPKGEELAEWKYRRYMQDYLGTIESVDESVGSILDFLDQNGLSENTIIVYTSDQGFFLGEHGWFDKRFMYEESLQIPLLIKYPKEISEGSESDEMVLNLDFAPTFLDYAGVAIPDEMQGASMRKILSGEKPDKWRKEVYYHYYEYPGPHDVKRHYGIRTNEYKLIHYYYDIDEWELFDLKSDPFEMQNQYNNPEYEEIVTTLKVKLQQLQQEYSDTNYLGFLPGKSFTEIKHLGNGSVLSFENLYSEKYTGGNHNALIDGKISVEDLSQVEDFDVWQGFEGDDLELVIDLQKINEICTISAGFLHNTNAWIFTPDWVEFSVSEDNKTYTSLGKVERTVPLKTASKERIMYDVKFNMLDARYIKVHAKNVGLCPEWHKGDGNPAWLFGDEVIIE